MAAIVRAMTQFGLQIQIDKRDVETWQRRFAVELPNGYARAHKWTLDEIAKQAVDNFRRDVGKKTIDKPTPWILRGIRYRRSVYHSNWDQQSSSIFVMDDQSAVLKYLMGERVRKPGDAGPSSAYVAVPRWRNLNKAGVKQDRYGNLPSATLQRFRREAKVTAGQVIPNPHKAGGLWKVVGERTSKKSKSGGVFFGAPVVRGKQLELGFYSRPKRKRFRGKKYNVDGVRLLIWAATETKHQPIMRRFWQRNAERAADDYSQLMGQELRRKLTWLAQQG